MLSERLTEQAEGTPSLFSERKFCIGTSPQRKANLHSRNKHKKSPYHIGKGIFLYKHLLEQTFFQFFPIINLLLCVADRFVIRESLLFYAVLQDKRQELKSAKMYSFQSQVCRKYALYASGISLSVRKIL